MEYGKKELPSMESIMAKVKAGQTSDKRPFIPEGLWKFRIDTVLLKQSKEDKTFFIVNLDTVAQLGGAPPEKESPVYNWMPNLGNELGAGDVKSFIATVFECADDEAAELLPTVVGEENPLSGVEMIAKAYVVMTKKNMPFTKVLWARADKYTEGDLD